MPESQRVPPHWVDRPSLRHQLDVGLSAPLTLLVAQAGAGKTVLLTQWVASRPDLAVAWIAVSRADDDAVHFAHRIVDALATVDPRLDDIGAPLGEPGGGLGAAMLEALAAALAEIGRDIVLIIDDLHNLSNRATVEDLWRLADRLPGNAHFMFSSRADLQLSWSRHRLQHGLVELRRAQFAMGEGETAAVLSRVSGTPVGMSAAAAVVRHTEGWAAGIQLAGLAMRFHGAEALVDILEQSDRVIVDYLSSEVLDAQTPERHAALLQLSALDEMSAGLVQALTRVENGAGLLNDLERESMFVVPLPGRRGWYRFHHLFRDLLRYRLRASDAEEERRLLRKAADWYATQGDTSSAIEYLLRARAWDDAFDLILARGRSVYERGDIATVARWLSSVPPEVRRQRSGMETLYAIMAGMTGRAGEAEDILRGLLSEAGTDEGHRLVAAGYLAAAVQFRPHPEVYLGDALRAVELLESQPDVPIPDLLQLTGRDLLNAVAVVSAGRAYVFMGQFDRARVWLNRAVASIGGRYTPYRIHALGSLALAHAWSGNLRTALSMADEALDLAREASLLAHPAPADAYIARGFVAIQRGEPGTEAISLHEGHLRAAANRRTQLMWVAHLASKLIDPTGTDQAAIAPVGTPPPVVGQALLAISHRIARLAGHPQAPKPQSQWSTLAFEEIAALIAGGRAGAARVRLEQIPFTYEAGEPVSVIEHRIVSGWLLAAEGRASLASEQLAAALETAEPEWLLHPFVRAGAQITPIIDGLRGKPSRFRRAVVQNTAYVGEHRGDDLIEPLTSREREILTYLPTRLTNGELASRCYVSVNTIKTHMAHIYRKLDVSGRTAAVERARELGLIDTADADYVL